MAEVFDMIKIYFDDDIQMTDRERIKLLLEVIENITDEYIVISDIARSYNLKPSDRKRIETSNDWVADQTVLSKKVEYDIDDENDYGKEE